MSVEHDDRRFRLIYRTLGISGRMKVGTLALLGRRASDPETAWLVYMFSLRQLRLRWLRLPFGVHFAGSLCLVVRSDSQPAPSACPAVLRWDRVSGLTVDAFSCRPAQRADRSGSGYE
jgi:hypothetical protein